MNAALTRKLGPLPVWGWVVAVGGIIVAIIVKRRISASAANASTSAPAVGSPLPPSGFGSIGLDPNAWNPIYSTPPAAPVQGSASNVISRQPVPLSMGDTLVVRGPDL